MKLLLALQLSGGLEKRLSNHPFAGFPRIAKVIYRICVVVRDGDGGLGTQTVLVVNL